MHILCILDWPVRRGDRWLWDLLPDRDHQVDFVLGPDSRPLTRLPGPWARFGRGLQLAVRAAQLARSKDFDLMVAWESKNGVPLAGLRWLQRRQRPPLAVLAFSAKPYLHLFQPLLSRWWQAVDAFTVPSLWEAAHYPAAFALPSKRTSVCHLGSYDVLAYLARIDWRPDSGPQTPYVFTGGQTDRDYGTFLTAMTGVDFPALLNAPRGALARAAPISVRVQDLMPRDQYFAAVAEAAIVVVPLRPVQHAAGLSLLLAALAAGRPIVCSATPVACEYVSDGETALLVPPGDASALRHAVARLIADEDLRVALGTNARRRWEEHHTPTAFAARVDPILTAVVEGRGGNERETSA